MMPLPKVLDQLLKDFDKAPGWIPLLILMLIGVQFAHLPALIPVFGMKIPVSEEVWASIATLLLYLLGDAIDERIFKKKINGKVGTRPLYGKAYAEQRSKAEEALQVGSDGLYALALKLVDAAEKDRGAIVIHFFNELAKFVRSLISPLAILSGYFVVCGSLLVGAVLLLSAAAALFGYPWLKVLHIQQLYSAVAEIAAYQEKFMCRVVQAPLCPDPATRQPGGNQPFRDAKTAGKDIARLFFWDGKFVGAWAFTPK